MDGEDCSREVEAALRGEGLIAKADYLRWARNGDLQTRARAFALHDGAWSRIRPEPSLEEDAAVVARYLMECLVNNPPEADYIYSGFEAAWQISSWLKALMSEPIEVGAEGIVRNMAQQILVAFKSSDPDTQNRIETGTLEHLLESPRLRPFFECWAKDPNPAVRDSYRAALEWGLDHTGEDGWP